MIVTFDSKTERMTQRGQHHGNARKWTIRVFVETAENGYQIVLRPKKPCVISGLADLIDDELRNLHNTENGLIHVRWEAIAR